MPDTRFPLSPELAKPVIIHTAGIAIILAVLVVISQMNYVVFHSVVEIATIAIAISIFVIVWNARDKIDNGYFIIVGLAILFIGVIDFVHTLAYKGMGVFPGNSADLPTQLWIAARYLQAFTLLAAPLMIGRRVRTAPVLAIFSAATVFLLWTIYAGIFPSCFVVGQGLTQFKIASEYVISLILVAATALLYWKRAAFDPRIFWLLAMSNVLTIGAELSFTAYVSVYGSMNMIGHLFRLVATYCMYLAIVVVGIRKPYALLWRKMNESERQYRELFIEMTNGYALHEIILDATGKPVDYRFLKVNPAFERMTRLSAADIEGKTVRQVLPSLELDWIEAYRKVVLTGTPTQFVNFSTDLGKWFEVYAFSPAPGKFATIFSDVTDRKAAEEEIARLASFPQLSPAMIFEIDPSEQVLFVNPSIQSTMTRLGLSSPHAFIPEDVHQLIHEWETRTRVNYDRECSVAGRYFLVTCYLSPEYRSIRFYLTDITDRKQAEEALRQANKQLNLLSSITRHDILNQLMALKGYLELSHEVIDKPETLIEYITKGETAANTIERQITFTKVYQELGAAAPAWQNVDASINKAVTGLPMRAVHVEVDPKDPEIFADPLFEKVFYNLIDNAFRYGGEGMKTIRVSSQESDAHLTLLCEDDGVGIPAEDKKKLFTKGFGKNTGLGLFLSREILAITGIMITENGVPGNGARFEITVPKGAWRYTGTGA
ncbi:MAG: MASE3 domain-containing protein [Dehalococcoidia bacterium]